MIVQRLHAIQHEHGYLPDAELVRLAQETGTPLYRLQEIASFFPHFRQEWAKPPHVEVHVCRDMACHLRGAPELTKELKKLERSGPDAVEVQGVSCLGRCDRAVACVVSRHGENPLHEALFAGRTELEMVSLVTAVINGDTPTPDTDEALDIDRSNWQIDVYADKEWSGKPYDAVRQYVAAHPTPVPAPPSPPRTDEGMSDDEYEAQKAKFTEDYITTKQPWLKRLRAADLRGMGGAGMPAYTKWFEVWRATAVDGSPEKYIVCNGDESEPSTFKDRELLLRTPHLVVEGVILAGLLTNATAGYIYVRHEYSEQIAALEAEIARAAKLGACGESVFNTVRRFPVSVFTSPGGYICGEESALIEAMEDRRAQPRNKPPELMTNGLYDKPTVVNNVETLAWAPAIMLRGGEWYAKAGVRGASGRRFFSLCGDVAKPGVFEVPAGTTLGELITMAGGMRDGKAIKAMAFSGPSGGLIPGSLPLPKDFASKVQKNIDGIQKKADDDAKKPAADAAKIQSRAAAEIEKFKKLMNEVVPDLAKGVVDIRNLPLDKGLLGTVGRYLGVNVMLGAGMAVYADPTDVLDHALKFTEFFRNESCGKCVPCRIGSQKLVDIGTKLKEKRDHNALKPEDLERLRNDIVELNNTLAITSICGLGRVAGSPLATAVLHFAGDLTLRKRV